MKLVDGLEKLIREKVSVAEEKAQQQREDVIARS